MGKCDAPVGKLIPITTNLLSDEPDPMSPVPGPEFPTVFLACELLILQL